MKKIIKFGVFIVLIILIAIVVFNYPRLNIITGFAAKSVCSCTFEAERDQQSIEADDNDIDPIYLAKNVINFEEKSVTSTVFGLKKRVAIYKSGIGCVLVPEDLKLTTSFLHTKCGISNVGSSIGKTVINFASEITQPDNSSI